MYPKHGIRAIVMTSVVSFFLAGNSYGQNSVGIGTETPNENAVLHLVSTGNNQGLLVPKLTTAQRTDVGFTGNLTSVENGLLVYDSDDSKFYYWQDTQWQEIQTGVNLVAGTGIDITGNVISNLGDGDSDAQNEIQDLQDVLSRGNDAGGAILSNIANPVAAQDAASKAYVDAINVSDGDSDPTNEIQDISVASNILAISGSPATVDLSVYLDNSDNQNAAGVPVTASGNLTSSDVQSALEELQSDLDGDGDTDATNEIQTAAGVPVAPSGNLISIDVQGALEELQGDLDLDLDQDPLNELQNITIAGNSLGISSGTGFNLSPAAPSTGQVLKWDGSQWLADDDLTAAGSTLPILGNAQLVTNDGGGNVAVSVSGDLNMTNTGAMTIQSGVVTSGKIQDATISNVDVAPAAGIVATKLQSTVMVEGENISLLNNNTGFISNLSTFTTDNLSEGATNLYYTDARTDARIAAASVTDLSDVTSVGSGAIITAAERTTLGTALQDLSGQTTDNLNEGATNLYFTNARADARIAAASVTDLSDVTSVGSGAIITGAERTAISTNTSDIATLQATGISLPQSANLIYAGPPTAPAAAPTFRSLVSQDIPLLDASKIGSGTLAVARGGTNAGTVGSAGSVAYSDGSAYQFTAAGTSGQFLTSAGAGAPTWQTLFNNLNEVPRGDGTTLVSSGIFSDGSNVGIGNSPGAFKLLVDNNSDATSLRLENSNSTNFLRTLSLTTFSVGTSGRQGIYNQVLEPAGDANGAMGIRNDMTPQGSGSSYMIYNQMDGFGSGARYGILNNINGAAGNGSDIYGERSNISHDGSGDAYGSYIAHSGTGGGIKYGQYVTGEDRNYFSGDVGIANTIPNERLTITGAISLDAVPQPSGTPGYGKIYSDASDLFFIDGSGNSTTLSAAVWNLSGGNASTVPGTGAGQNYLGTSDGQDFLLGTTALERLRITAGGDVGIGGPGSAVTGNKLRVVQSLAGSGDGVESVLTTSAAAGTNQSFNADITGTGGATSSGYRASVTNQAGSSGAGQGYFALMLGDGDGLRYGVNVNIGGGGTGSKFGYATNVSPSSGANGYGFYVQDVTGSTNNYGVFVESLTGEPSFYPAIFMDGNVGIGTTSPAAGLHSDSDLGALFEGTFGSGTIPIETAGTRLMWYPGKAALRAGRDVSGAAWTDANTGDFSVAMGQGTIASGASSVSLGSDNIASGDFSFSAGQLNNATGIRSVSMGYINNADLEASVAIGYGNNANGSRAAAIGNANTASANNSYAFGWINTSNGNGSMALGYVTNSNAANSLTLGSWVDADGIGSMTIGKGVSSVFPLANPDANSLMVGFNSNIPTLYVGASSGIGTVGNVGIGTSSPRGNLDIVGSQFVSVRSLNVAAGAFAVNNDDYIIDVTTAGVVGSSATLPDANTNAGRVLIFRVRGPQPLNIVRSGSDLIEGLTSYSIQDLIVDDVNGVTIVSVGGGNWIITQTSIK